MASAIGPVGQCDQIVLGSNCTLDAIRAIIATMTTLDLGMQQNAAMPEQTSAALAELLRSARDLTGQVVRFQRDNDAGPAAPICSRAA